jgi:hypothetical protein
VCGGSWCPTGSCPSTRTAPQSDDAVSTIFIASIIHLAWTIVIELSSSLFLHGLSHRKCLELEASLVDYQECPEWVRSVTIMHYNVELVSVRPKFRGISGRRRNLVASAERCLSSLVSFWAYLCSYTVDMGALQGLLDVRVVQLCLDPSSWSVWDQNVRIGRHELASRVCFSRFCP